MGTDSAFPTSLEAHASPLPHPSHPASSHYSGERHGGGRGALASIRRKGW
jgi:hypothetical protein